MINRRILGCWALAFFAMPLAAVAEDYPADWYWGDTEQREQHATMEGKPVPDLILSDWLNGEPALEDLEDKIVVLDFWATWLEEPYLKNVPYMNQLSQMYADRGVVVIGICGSTGQAFYEETVEEAGMAYPVARDPAGKNAQRWKVFWWPTYAVVARDGTLAAIGLKSTHVEDVVRSLLDAESAATQPEDTSFEADADSDS